jgi:hypothetical protein
VGAGAKATVRSILAYFSYSIPLRGSSVVLSEEDETLWMFYCKQSGVGEDQAEWGGTVYLALL